MRTDDFLADLELQLRDARPPRDLRPAAALTALAAVAVLALAVLVLAPHGSDRVPAAAPDDVRVIVRNGTQIEGLPENTVKRLRHNGYQVVAVTDAPDRHVATTTVQATSDAAEPAAEALGALINRPPHGDDGWTGYAPLRARGQVVVTLGSDVAPTVLVSNDSGIPGAHLAVAARLRSLGFQVEVSELGSDSFSRTEIQKSGQDRHRSMLVARALGLDGSHIHGRGAGAADVDVVVYVGRDLASSQP